MSTVVQQFVDLLNKDLVQKVEDVIGSSDPDYEMVEMRFDGKDYWVIRDEDIKFLAVRIVEEFVDHLRENGELNPDDCDSCAKIAAIAKV